MDNKNYDYCIVGAGPSGLFLAYLLSKYKKKVLIIDRESTIGGCHRVRRLNNFFTEHGPRIYSSAYVNTISLLKDMGINFYDHFVPYNFNLSKIGGKSASTIKIYELFWLTFAFLSIPINDIYTKSKTCLEFMKEKNFTEKTIDYVDRICRLTDGAGANKYTLFEFLQTLNQNYFYKIYQPNKPTDTGLFDIIKKKLENNGVDFLLDSEIVKLNETNGSTISNIECKNIKNNINVIVTAKNFVLAIPPSNIMKILNNSNNIIKNSFGNYDKLMKWVEYNSYNVYISISFHWDKEINLPKRWGFPASKWGVAYIVLTDYMSFTNPKSKTVISCCITKFESNINEEINNLSKKNIINGVFKQLKETYPDLPKPSMSILSPGDYYLNGKWKTKDDAYMMTKDIVNGTPFRFKSSLFNNLYNLGTHNGYSKYHFTSLESAVTNSLKLGHELIPEIKNDINFQIKKPWEITDVIKIVAGIIFTLFILFFLFY